MQLENYKDVHDLLLHGTIELPYPLINEPWRGADGYWIDEDTAPIITPESLRICTYDLYILANSINGQSKQKTRLNEVGQKTEGEKSLVKAEVVGETDSKETNPPPEERVRGSDGVNWLLKANLKTPNWDFWRHMPEVALWEACILSLNIEPDSMRPDRATSNFFDNGPYFGKESFPNIATKIEYERRLKLLTKDWSNSSFFSPRMPNIENPNLHQVSLAEFAAWSLFFGWELPPELENMASQDGYQVEQKRLTEHDRKVPTDDKLTSHVAPEFPTTTVPSLVVPVHGGLSQDSALVAETTGLGQNPAIELYYEAERAFSRNLWMDELSRLEHEKDILERFKLGRYTLAVVAVELANKTGWGADRWLATIKQAIESGALPLKNPENYTDNLPYPVPEKLRDYRDQVSAVDVNAWLANQLKWHVTARLDYESVVKQTSQSVPVKTKAKNVWDECALRQLLIKNNEPGMTHKKLAAEYGVTRQRIGAILKQAREIHETKKGSWLDPVTSKKPKKSKK